MSKFSKSGCIVCGATVFKNPDISLHRFPSDLNQRYRWIEACKLDDTFFNTSSRICSLHFKHEYFKTKCLRRILYPGSVPTIFTEEEMKNNRNMIPKIVRTNKKSASLRVKKEKDDASITKEEKIAKIVRTYNRSVNIGIKKEKVDASTTEKEVAKIVRTYNKSVNLRIKKEEDDASTTEEEIPKMDRTNNRSANLKVKKEKDDASVTEQEAPSTSTEVNQVYQVNEGASCSTVNDYNEKTETHDEIETQEETETQKETKTQEETETQEETNAESVVEEDFCPRTMCRYSSEDYEVFWICRICLRFMFSRNRVIEHLEGCNLPDYVTFDDDEESDGEFVRLKFNEPYSSSDDE